MTTSEQMGRHSINRLLEVRTPEDEQAAFSEQHRLSTPA